MSSHHIISINSNLHSSNKNFWMSIMPVIFLGTENIAVNKTGKLLLSSMNYIPVGVSLFKQNI